MQQDVFKYIAAEHGAETKAKEPKSIYHLYAIGGLDSTNNRSCATSRPKSRAKLFQIKDPINQNKEIKLKHV